ncbi:las seventeen-binding [Trichoderma arundinaceum]|uniref:Las seventeen-binding n=1 Tax=Trichoderma arundinaceum TaxID=490622 RepID=A0A395N8R9_TRIAR|nr:las seventeen-binding [Trichoderma arundinaceum]
MQRVSAFLPSWEKRNSGSNKAGSGSLFGWSNRTSQPPPPNGLTKINTDAANMQVKRVQREAFWPATLDLECDKAARILKSFCVDGYFAPIENDAPPSPSSTSTGVRTLDQVPRKIPKRIIQNAAGIAVFTCMRSGLWMTGSGGSGILIARKSDGTWSPPSGIMLHTPTLSFIIGVDVYDCVLVISSLAALESVTRPRVTLGEDVELRAGEAVSLVSDESEINWRELGNTVLTYMKARGQQQSVNLHGCMLSERSNENERFYASSDVTHMDILAGNVARNVEETTPLNEVLKMAEGRTDYDMSIINKVAAEPAPSDALITTSPPKSASMPSSPHSSFGIPQVDDPDPFGVLALEMAGLEIREAGSRMRPTSSLFDMNQNPMSPIAASKFSRQSMDTFVSRSNRGSYVSMRTIRSQVTDAGTQTDTGNTPETSPSPGPSGGSGRASPAYIPAVKEEDEEDEEAYKVEQEHAEEEEEEEEEEDVEMHTVSRDAEHRLSKDVSIGPDSADEAELSQCDTESISESLRREEDAMSHGDSSEEEALYEDDSSEDDLNDADDEDDIEEEEPVVFEVAAVQRTSTQILSSRMIQARGNVVTIAKRVPPPLPTRSPARMSRNLNKDAAVEELDLRSPLSQTFSSDGDLEGQEAEAHAESIDAVAAVEHQEQEAEHSESEESDAADEPQRKAVVPEDDVPSADESSADEVDLEQRKQGDVLLHEPHSEQADNSDAASNKKKHTSSIYTGVTEDRWSCDGSSVTTPTSEQRFSLIEDKVVDETPKKSIQEADEAHDSPAAPTEVAHIPVTVAN